METREDRQQFAKAMLEMLKQDLFKKHLPPKEA